jgi:hypothetical protein
LSLHGMTSYFPTRKPTIEELETSLSFWTDLRVTQLGT